MSVSEPPVTSVGTVDLAGSRGVRLVEQMAGRADQIDGQRGEGLSHSTAMTLKLSLFCDVGAYIMLYWDFDCYVGS